MKTRARTSRRAAGFSLIEMMVSMFITAILITGVLTMFQTTSNLARKQTQIADMQQNMRVALYDILRQARMAGRGGLPAFVPPDTANGFAGSLLPTDGVAVAIQNNVPNGTTVAGNLVFPGTDILTVRGVLNGPIFQVQSNNEDFTNRRLQLDMLALGVPQDLQEIADSTLAVGSNETLQLVSSRGATLYGLAEIAGGGSIQTAPNAQGDLTTVGVTVPFTTNGAHVTDYRRLMRSGQFPPAMDAVAYMGILEEYRYYVRAQPIDPSDLTAGFIPRLSRARFFPGSQTVHPSNPNGREDIADNVWDLQIALGVDQDGDGEAEEGATLAERATDEWLFNHEDDDDSLDDPGQPANWRWNGDNNPLNSLRVSVLVRSARPEIQFVSKPIDRIEDRLYNEVATPQIDELPERRFYRRLMQAMVDFRNF